MYFDGIDVSEGINVNKKIASKECDICHYWYFLNCSFRFQLNSCNRCHDYLMMPMNLTNISILSIKSYDYLCIVNLFRKNEVIFKILKLNAKCLFDQNKHNIIEHKNLLSDLKMHKEILTFGNIKIEKNK